MMNESIARDAAAGPDLARAKVSGVVISYNRVDLIGTCLKALSFVDELLVIDKSSTDGTAQLAAGLADRVVVVPWSPVVEQTREFAVAQCTYDWIVCMDDDECLSVGAVEFIEKELAAPRAGIYLLAQRHYILGIHDERAYYWPEYQPRFFRRDAVSFTETTHGGTQFAQEDVYVVPFEGGASIHHLSHKNVAQWIEKANRYTSNVDRVRAVHPGNDLVAFAHQTIDRYASATKTDDRSTYPAAVAVLRALYDMIDRLKSWEEEEGLDGDKLFQKKCAELEADYLRELPRRQRGVAQLEQVRVDTEPLTSDRVDQPYLALMGSIESLREAMRAVRAAAEEERRAKNQSLEGAREALAEAQASVESERRQHQVALDEHAQIVASEKLAWLAATESWRAREAELNQQVATLGMAFREVVGEQEDSRLLRADLAEARRQLHDVVASTSWRVTAPLRRFGTRYPGAIGRLRDFAARHPTLRRRAVKTVRWGLSLLGGRPAQPSQAGPAAVGASVPPPAPKSSVLALQVIEPAQAGGNIKPLPAGRGKRVLSVGHVMPWPPRAGNEYRIHQMLSRLASEDRDVLLVVCPLPNELPSPRRIAEAAAIYPQLVVCGHDGLLRHNLPVGSPLLEGLERLAVRDFASILGEKAASDSRSAQLLGLVRTFCPDLLVELLLSLESSFKPQVLLTEYVFMARPFALMRKDLPKIIDTIDVFSTKSSKVERYGVTDGLAMSEAEESELLGRADVLIAIQPAEATDLVRLAPASKVITVGVDFLVQTTASAPAHGPVVLLVASSNPMNVKGLQDFLRFSWPFVRRQVPDAELRVVGDVGAAIDLVPQGVRILGRVENLEQAYASAKVVINPTVAGTGLKIKTVEALCHLRPIVTFPAGVDGVGDAASALCSIATDWFSFAQHVSRLLGEPVDPAALAEHGKNLAAHFSPATVYAPLTKVLDEI